MMKRTPETKSNNTFIKLTTALLIRAIVITACLLPLNSTQAATNNQAAALEQIYRHGAAQFDYNLGSTGIVPRLVRITVNPLTKNVTAQILL